MPGDEPTPPKTRPSESLGSKAADQNDFKLKRNVSNSVFALVANAFLAFWSYRLVIQSGGIELLGLWSALQAWLWLVRIGDLGVAGAATRFLGMLGADATDRDRREIIDTALVANVVIFASISALGYIVMSTALPVVLPGGTDAGLLLVAQKTLPIMFISFFLMGIFYPLNGSLMGLYVGYLAARLSMLGVLLQLGLAVVLIPLYGLVGLALAQLVQSAFLVIAAWAMVVRQTRCGCSMLPLTVSLSKAKKILRYSVRLQAVSLASAFYDPIAKVIVGYFGGLTLLGFFELANRTVQLPRSAVGSGVMAVLPAMTNLVTHDHGRVLELYERTLKRVVIAMAGITICVALGAPVASYFWLGGVDSTYLWMVGVLMVGQFANAIGAPGYAMGSAAGRLRSNLVAAAIAIGVLVLLSLALHELISGFGAVLAVAAGLVIGGVLTKVLNEQWSIGHGVASEKLL